jgi:hypothetical protein
MSASQHTPGPWEPDRDARAVYAGNMRVCDIRGWGHLTGGGHTALNLSGEQAVAIQAANARLIAAAPAMLSALKAIEDWWLSEGMHSFTGAPFAMFAAREAIAKVEGVNESASAQNKGE